MTRREISIDGNNFSDLESFYDETDRLLTKNLSWKTGHNLMAFNDLLRGGFGVHEYGEPLEIHWKNSTKSRNDLGFEETSKYLISSLKTCHPSNKKQIKQSIRLAKRKQGKTLFDIICETIINSHETGHNCTLILE